MRIKEIIFGLILVLAISLNSCQKKGNSSNSNAGLPVMAFQEKEHDFGSIKEGDKVSYVFHFKNEGNADLLIENAYGSCGCTIPDYPKDPIKPGNSGTIKVSFNSAGKSGMQHKTVTMNTNTKLKNEIITIKASVQPKAEN